MKIEGSSIAFIVICTGLVFLMTPALAFFYGGLERRKNVISTMMMSVVSLALATVMWFAVGYSLSFSGDGNLIGDLGHAFFLCVSDSESTRGLMIPDSLFAVFQMMFSIITVGILTGSVVGRMRFKPLLIFIVGWLLLVYYPFAHMVWDEGLLAQWGTIDFAGGDVVHITSGVSGLVLALVVGKRKDFNRLEYRPHNVPFVLLGAGLLWFGWFGFNPGSQLAAATGTDQTVISHVFLTTNLAACAGGFFALTASWIKYGKPSLSLTLNGVLAGLVGVTAGCDLVSPFGAVMIGAICGIVMIFSVDFIDHILKIDDPVGASSVHGVCGCLGTILTGLFATEEGLLYGGGYNFLLAQLFGTTVVGCWAAGMGYLIFKGLDKIHGLRVPNRIEEEGLDIYEHGESAYN